MKKKRILIIDDEHNIRFVVSICLEEFGAWEVLTTESAKEGLILARTEQPDAILLDVMMPEMDGITVFNYLKSDPLTQTVPIIFMTAKVQSSELQELSSLGVAGIISKPFDPYTLIEQITELLQW